MSALRAVNAQSSQTDWVLRPLLSYRGYQNSSPEADGELEYKENVYRLEGRCLIPGRDRDFSPRHHIYIGPGFHPIPIQWEPNALFPMIQWPTHEADHSSPPPTSLTWCRSLYLYSDVPSKISQTQFERYRVQISARMPAILCEVSCLVIFLKTSRTVVYLRLVYDCLFPRRFKFVIHSSSYHLTYNLKNWKLPKINTTKKGYLYSKEYTCTQMLTITVMKETVLEINSTKSYTILNQRWKEWQWCKGIV